MGGIQGLLAQAAPTAAPASGMTDEQIAKLLAQVQANQAADPTLAPSPAPSPSPSPAPAQAAQPGLLARMLSGLSNMFMGGTSAKELAAPPQAGALTPEELERRRRIMQQQGQ